MVSEDLLPIGKIVKTHGLRGHLKVVPSGEVLASLTAGETVLARLRDGTLRRLTVEEVRPHQRAYLVVSREIDSRESAAALVGAELCLPESKLPPLGPDEFYWHQLVGLEVVNSKGDKLGTLEQIIETGSNDVYVVRKGKQEILIPATHEAVLEVNLEEGRMVVDPPEMT
ncbi:MAG: 16S rRNA processing protein RimM [Deltaproteobacteria bacterium]|nr:16S rRNA processing protein RimM [Deltaproteobacteria bacterium]MBW2070941.1 16S rRNA processing protein RimM [Deltaproteobacteria bacterium]